MSVYKCWLVVRGFCVEASISWSELNVLASAAEKRRLGLPEILDVDVIEVFVFIGFKNKPCYRISLIYGLLAMLGVII